MDRKDIVKSFKDYECYLRELPIVSVRTNLLLNVLEMLEPSQAEIEGGNISYWHVCGECHSQIDPKFTFCPYCGREIQW